MRSVYSWVRFGSTQTVRLNNFQRVFDQLQENLITYIQPTQDIKVTEVKGSFKRLKLIDVPGAQHILEQIPPENWHESVEKGGLDLGGPNGRFKIHIGLFAPGYPKYIIEYK